MATAQQPIKTRHKWTAGEKRELISKLNKAKRGEADGILKDFSERTGASPASVRAYFYALKADKKKKASPSKRPTAAPKGASKSTPMERLASQHSALQAAVASAEKSLAQATKALSSFEEKLGRLA